MQRSFHSTKGKKGGGGGSGGNLNGGNNNLGGNQSSLDNYYGSTMGEKILNHHHHYPPSTHYETYNSNGELRSKSAGISGSTTMWGGNGHGGINRLAPLGTGSLQMNHHGGINNIGGKGGGEGGGGEDHLSRSSSLDGGHLLGTLPRFVHSAPAVARSLNLPPLQAAAALNGSGSTHSHSHGHHGHGQFREV